MFWHPSNVYLRNSRFISLRVDVWSHDPLFLTPPNHLNVNLPVVTRNLSRVTPCRDLSCSSPEPFASGQFGAFTYIIWSPVSSPRPQVQLDSFNVPIIWLLHCPINLQRYWKVSRWSIFSFNRNIVRWTLHGKIISGELYLSVSTTFDISRSCIYFFV